MVPSGYRRDRECDREAKEPGQDKAGQGIPVEREREFVSD